VCGTQTVSPLWDDNAQSANDQTILICPVTGVGRYQKFGWLPEVEMVPG